MKCHALFSFIFLLSFQLIIFLLLIRGFHYPFLFISTCYLLIHCLLTFIFCSLMTVGNSCLFISAITKDTLLTFNLSCDSNFIDKFIPSVNMLHLYVVVHFLCFYTILLLLIFHNFLCLFFLLLHGTTRHYFLLCLFSYYPGSYIYI